MHLADSILKNCMAESNIADLNTAIYLLGHAAHTWLDKSPQSSKCVDLLVTALLTRFSYTSQWEDVRVASLFRLWMLQGSLPDHTLQWILRHTAMRRISQYHQHLINFSHRKRPQRSTTILLT
jgi:hypothetical protein